MPKKIRILLINPVTKRYFWNQFYFPSLGLPLLAALTPGEIDVRIIDETENTLIEYPEADIVGISVLTASAKRAYEIADIYRHRGTTVVLGGIHVSSLPDEAVQHADSIVIGEGDPVWLQILEDYKQDRMKQIYRVGFNSDISELPGPRWDLIEANVKGKNIIYSVQAGRGCPNKCNFCNVPEVFGRKYRTRPIEKIITEIKEIQKTKLLILDDNLIANIQFAREFLNELIPLKKEWMGLASLANLNREDIIKLLAESGCKHLFIGFETINPDNISIINKKVNKVTQYGEVIKKLQNYGIKIIGSFIVGMDYDDEGVFDQIYEFILNKDIYIPIVNILTPYPGTKIFEQFKAEGRMLTYDWSKYSCDEVVFQPKKMSPETLKEKHEKLHYNIVSLLRSKFSQKQKRSYSIYDF